MQTDWVTDFLPLIFCLQILVLAITSHWIYKRLSPTESVEAKRGAWRQAVVVVCVLIAGWRPLTLLYHLNARFPRHMDEDMFSGLPMVKEPLVSFLFHDLGRPSYIYNLIISGMSLMPGAEIWHLKQLFILMGFVFIFAIFRALDSFSCGPLLLVLVANSQLWETLLQPFRGCRSWGTELLFLALALCCLSPRIIATRRWGIPGALVFLGLACLESPFELVHFVGFGLGLLLYARTQPSSNGKHWSFGALAGGVLFTLLTASIAVLAVRYGFKIDANNLAAGDAAVQPWAALLRWWENMRDSTIIPWFVACVVLSLRPPAPSWYPIIGGALGGIIACSLAPLYVAEHLTSTPDKIWKPTLVLVALTTLGLAWQHLQSLIQAAFGTASGRSSQAFAFHATAAAAFVYFAISTTSDPENADRATTGALLQPESAATIYRHFKSSENTLPVHLSEVFLLTSMISTNTDALLDGLRRTSVHAVAAIEPPWVFHPPDCSASYPFRVVSLGEHYDVDGGLQSPCPVCVPDPEYSGEGAKRFRTLDPLIKISIDSASYSSFAPYVIWLCDPLEAPP
jgi:hypothetical protein